MNGFEGYDAIASVYDKLNADIDYSAWADFLEECYDTEHTLSLDTALDDLDAICKRNSEVMA